MRYLMREERDSSFIVADSSLGTKVIAKLILAVRRVA